MTCVEAIQQAYAHKQTTRRPYERLVLITAAVFNTIEAVIPHFVKISNEYATLRTEYSNRNNTISPVGYTRHRDRFRAYRRNDLRFARAVDALVAKQAAA